MEEAERLCQRIVIVDHGKVIADDDLRGLERRLPESRRLTVDLDVVLARDPAPDAAAPAWLAELAREPGVEAAAVAAGRLTVDLAELSRAPAVLAFLSAHGQPFTHFATERADLESIFLALTGRTLRDQAA
ncbi:MAG: hypothetical protein KC635_05600, partial [Myxococcales bacterium]|nr:hypothetical protein [Myxococcales bacterium]